MPPWAYRAYVIAAPLRTHWTLAGCREYECDGWLHGWDSLIDEGSELGQRQAWYIRSESRRRYTEERQPDGLTRFSFEAGQECFQRPHRTRNTRPERFVERDGDYRANPTGRRYVHQRPDDWVESFALHQGKLAAIAERG